MIQKRVGTAILGATLSESVMGGREFDRSEIKYVVRVGLTKVQEFNDTTLVWDNISPVPALTGSDTDAISFATPLLAGERILCFTNYVDAIQKYDTTTVCVNLGGSPPRAKFIQDYASYLLLAYVDDGTVRGSRVQWCAAGDPEDWTGGDSGSKDLFDDGENITGMGLFGNFVAIHNSKAIYLGYLVTTSSVFKFDRKSTGAGTVANNSIQNLPTGEQAFLANDGIRLFNGISAPLIDNHITEDLRQGVSPQFVSRVWSVVVEELDEYWLGVPIGDEETGSTVYKFNYRTRSCHKDTRPDVVSAFKYTQTTQPTWDDQTLTWAEATDRWNSNSLTALFQIVVLNDINGITVRRDPGVNDDNGEAVNAFWETKDYEDEGEEGRLCQWVEMQLWSSGSTVVVEYSTDSGQTWTSASNSPVTLTADFPTDDAPLRVYFDVVSSKIRFRFRNSTSSETFTLKQFVISYRQREMRGA